MRSDTKNDIGKKFGRVTVLSMFNKKNHTYAECICECGNKKDIRIDALRSGKTKSCGCFNAEVRKRKTQSKYESHKNLIYHYYKKSAKERCLEFSITRDELIDIITNDCFYCGDSPTLQTTPYKRKEANGFIIANGADRIDNSKGYTIDNIVPCCSKCNKIKMDMKVEDFLDKIEKISNRKQEILLKIGLGGYVVGRSVEKSVKAYTINKGK